MKNLFRLLVAVATLNMAGTVAAAQEPPQREATIQEIAVRGTVEAIDHTARVVKIRGDQGNIITLDVPASYTRFDQVKVGDIVNISYYDRVSLRLKPVGEAAVDTESAPTTTLTPGLMPGGTRAVQRVTTVRIDGWDPATRLVTFSTPSGASYTRRVAETVDPNVLAGLKVSDRVDVTRTEAISLMVLPSAAQQPVAAAAGAQNPQREAIIQEITVRGTVEAVDHTARVVKIRGDQGNTTTFDVPASYTRFDQVRVGDIVTISYYDRVILRVKPAGEAAVDTESAPTTTLTPGLMPGGTRVVQRVTTVTINGWDAATRNVTFSTPSGQSYTRRVSETVDPTVIAGLKIGDRVDVTRTEALSVSVVTPAPAQPVEDTLRHRLTLSVLWGPDNSFSGEIAQSGDGTYQGAPIAFNDTSYDDVYGRIGLLKIGIGYRMKPRVETNFNIVFSKSTSEDAAIGTIGAAAAPLSVKFDDYNYWGFEGGQRFFFARVRFTPYVGYTIGVNHLSAIGGQFTAPAVGGQPPVLVDAGQFYDSSWALSYAGTVGFLAGVGPFEVMVESGFRYMGGLADVPPLQETGLAHINDDSGRWSIPVMFGLRLRF